MNWYKRADAYGRQPEPMKTLAVVKNSFQITVADEAAGKVRLPWSLKRRDDRGSLKIYFNTGNSVIVWKAEQGFWNIIKTDQVRSREEPILISEEMAKEYLKSERDEGGKLIQSTDAGQLQSIVQKRLHYQGESDVIGNKIIDFAAQKTAESLNAMLAKYNATVQDILADQTNGIIKDSLYLFDQASLKNRIIQDYNMAVNNPWSMQDLMGTLLMYTGRSVSSVEEFLKAKAGKSKQQLRRKTIEDRAKQMGMNVCQRCGGEGGSSAWDATGWECYECGGFGMVPPKAGM